MRILIGFLYIFFLSAPVWAQDRISVTGILSHASLKAQEEFAGTGASIENYDGQLGFGGGIGYYNEINSFWGFDFQINYYQRRWENSSVEEKFDLIQESIMGRMWLTDSISFGLGLYFAQGLGKVERKSKSSGTTSEVEYKDYFGSDDELRKNELGWTVSLGYFSQLFSSTGYFFDVKFQSGLTDRIDGPELKAGVDEYLLRIGLDWKF